MSKKIFLAAAVFFYLFPLTIFAFTDTDCDGLPDYWETQYNLNLTENDAYLDPDNDALENIYEYQHNTNPQRYDTDGDGIPDGWEVDNLLNPAISDIGVDEDNDGLDNPNEYLFNTDPRNPDMDNDGLTDGEEMFHRVIMRKLTSEQTCAQSSPYVCCSGTNYLVTWCRDTDNDGWEIFGKIFDNNGIEQSSEIHINTFTTNSQTDPRCASDGTDYLVVWTSAGHYDNGEEIRAQRISSTGEKIGDEFQINSYTSNRQIQPFISYGNSAYLVSWSSYTRAGRSAYAAVGRVYDITGNPLTNEFMFTDNPNYSFVDTATTSVGNEFFAVWYSGVKADIFGQFVDTTGQVNPYQSFSVTKYSWTYDYNNPAIAASNHNILVCCERKDAPSPHYKDITCGFLNFDSTKKGFHQVNTFTEKHQQNPFVSSNGDDYLILWENHGKTPETICGQFYHYTEEVIGANFELFSTALQPQYRPIISSDGNDFFAAWYENSNIHGAIIKANAGYGADPYKSDTDDDSLSDYEEAKIYNTNPRRPDTDSDGVTDYKEVKVYNTNPLLSDTDNDGLSDYEEIYDYFTNPLITDSDCDGLPDKWELDNLLNPNQSNIGLDTDNDGILDIDEFSLDSSPTNPDVDNDYLLDGEELIHNTNLFAWDTDNDGFEDGWEFLNGFDPLNPVMPDSDNDGLNDPSELYFNTDPYNHDCDNDGLLDGQEVISIHGNIKIANDIRGKTNFDIATNGDTFLVAWLSTESVVKGVLLDSSGTVIKTISYIGNANCPCGVSVASDGTGYLVTWTHITYYSQDVLACRISANGDVMDNPPLQLNETDDSGLMDNYESYATSNGTDYLVAWKRLYGVENFTPHNVCRRIQTDGTFTDDSYIPVGLTYYLHILPYDTDYLMFGTRYTAIPSPYWPTSYRFDGVYAVIISAGDTTRLDYSYKVADYYDEQQAHPYNLFSFGNSFLAEIQWASDQYQLFALYPDELGIEPEIIADTPVTGQNDMELFRAYTTTDNDGTVLFGRQYGLDNLPRGIAFRISSPYSFESIGKVLTSHIGHNYGIVWEGVRAAGESSSLYFTFLDWRYNSNPFNSDTDNDGFSDAEEIALNLAPTSTDTDSDTIPDTYEIDHNLNPNLDDTRLDYDNDHLNNIDEYNIGSNPWLADTDNDGMPDGWEHNYGLDLFDNDSHEDPDNDDLWNITEYSYNSNPLLFDTDNDTLSDWDEIYLHHTAPDLADSDNDNLIDPAEISHNTDPLNADSDNDGLSDGFEVLRNYYDGFESGDFSKLDWSEYTRVIGNNNPYKGNYCAYSGGIFSLTIDALPDQTVLSFYYRSLELEVFVYTPTNEFRFPASLQWQHATCILEEGCTGVLFGVEPSFPADILPLNPYFYIDEVCIGGKEINSYTTDPTNPDTDSDGIPDGWEINQDLNPTENESQDDSDNDGLTNIAEYQIRSNPLCANTDNDRLDDRAEIIAGTDPLDPSSCFEVNEVFQSSSDFVLSWQSVPGKKYTIYVKSDMIGADFVILHDDYTATAAISSYHDQGNSQNNVPPASQETGVRLYKITVKE